MNIKMFQRIGILYLVMFLAVPFYVFAQQGATGAPETAVEEKSPRDEYTEAERPEENYLARFEGIRVSEKLMKENLENIFILKVIVSNFKDQGWDKDYQDIYENYKKGVSLFYRRIVVYSRVELEKNKKAISELYKKMVTLYRKDTHALLKECADKILDFSLEEKNKYDPNRSRILFKNMMRLWIAYGQVDDAESSYIENVFRSSISHYRIAKSYAISILEQLDPEKSKGRFDIQKADNRNRILNPEKVEKPKT